ncbi:MAG: hypothetical protein HS130_12610 [Deltaproteobacteria bacterium]|nr:hypothetical protein [Deltaproteobacteria bacterium]MCL4874659.1 hypothetical protein [bacterium]
MKIDWKAVKRGYQGGTGAPELAKRHGCSAETVRRKARKENWSIKEPKESAADPDAGVGAAADHRTLLNGVRRRLVKGLENADLKLGLEELKVAKTALEVLSDYRKEEELALGLGSGRKELEHCDALAAEMAEATAPSGADETLERE